MLEIASALAASVIIAAGIILIYRYSPFKRFWRFIRYRIAKYRNR